MEVFSEKCESPLYDYPCNKVITKGLTLKEVIQHLNEAFKSDNVNIDRVKDIMAAYRSNPQEWKKYAKFDRYRYTRNLVDEGNGRFNLIALCWGEGHGSAIHDHADAHCVMKILQGELCETTYAWPARKKDGDCSEAPQELRVIGKTTFGLNDVAYINDNIGLHRVENSSTVNPAVSLHLYSPPFSSCSVFNKQTGQSSPCKVTFWSKYGEHRNREIQDMRASEDN
ncbi:cysteine dioxygenase type 1 isoform X2 [Belonocnema kinseyi]|nr:cysteine dioxygenase type 1 isoform X2 [Belonocnema kinseyi]